MLVCTFQKNGNVSSEKLNNIKGGNNSITVF